ncbi:MAG TPA: hypothetical protein VE994_17590 [Terriglobales bacterium]|nr:hypothetical protein [Terriglobales bacterium]
MSAEIRIRWDGDVPGLAEHRVSLTYFGEALALLVAALRRIATQIVSAAANADNPKSGRLTNVARQLDIQIESIQGNSGGFDGIVTFEPPPDVLPLFGDLPARATIELLDSIERESKGQPSNWAVRKYLSALPTGVRKQTYDFHDNGAVKKHVEIGDVQFAAIPADLPSLREYEGDIVGVGFEPGRPEVRIKTGVSTPNLDATSEQVEEALHMRKEKVRVLGVNDGKRTRLLAVAEIHEPRFERTDEAVEEHIFKRWSGVFSRLARE